MNFEKSKKSEFWKNEKKLLEISYFTHVYQKPQSYEVHFLRYGVKQIIFVILGHFLPFNPPPTHPIISNNPENENFEKMKKASGDVIILNLCNKNTIKWCMVTQIWSVTDIIFCRFRPFFALSTHYWPQKLKFGKNVNNAWRYYSFTHVHHNSRSYDVWFLRCKGKSFLSFWAIFALWPS